MAEPPAGPMLHIDWTRCDGRGLCTELLPELLARDKWGYPVAIKGAPAARSDIVIGSRHLDAATDAVVLCPLLALTIVGSGR